MKLFNMKKDQFVEFNRANNTYQRNREPNIGATDNPNQVNNNSSCRLCHGCGRTHGSSCLIAGHPDYNTEPVPWAQSTKGLLWAAKGNLILPWRETLTGVKWAFPVAPESKNNNNNRKR
jgi:hypothetical protein